jgi:hypothetical protein
MLSLIQKKIPSRLSQHCGQKVNPVGRQVLKYFFPGPPINQSEVYVVTNPTLEEFISGCLNSWTWGNQIENTKCLLICGMDSTFRN